jgi:hypothetical protein
VRTKKLAGQHLNKRSALLAGPAAAALLIVAAAVFSSQHPSHRPPAVPRLPVSSSDVQLLMRAEQELIRACMNRHGFKYWPIPGSQAYPTPHFATVVASVPWARKYGLGGDPAITSPSDPNERYFNNLQPAQRDWYSNALVGSASGGAVTVSLPTGGILGHSSTGCQARADTELYGSYQAWFRASSVAFDLSTLQQLMVVNDHQYQRSVASWSRCMQAKGHPYSSPGQAAGAFRRPISAHPSRAETLVAVAEAVCANSTGLTEITRLLNRAFISEVDHKYQYSLQAEWSLERNALPMAKRVFGSH